MLFIHQNISYTLLHPGTFESSMREDWKLVEYRPTIYKNEAFRLLFLNDFVANLKDRS